MLVVLPKQKMPIIFLTPDEVVLLIVFKIMTESKKEILFVKYKNYNGNYQAESKLPFLEINADKFNPEYHKKLIWKNFWYSKIKPIKIDWHNPWIV